MSATETYEAATGPSGASSSAARGPGPGLFGSARREVVDALGDPGTRVVVLGVPYDVGSTGRPGSRFGPHYLRTASQGLFRAAGLPGAPGMYDPVRDRQVLAGVGIADLGDLSADVHTRNGDTLTALEQLTAAATRTGKVPVVLGGDHSVTLPAVRGVMAGGERVGIIHFDAHLDYGRPRRDDWRGECHHGNFMDWLVGDDRVERVVQIGVRQLIAKAPSPSEKITRWPGTTAAGALAEVLAGLPEDLAYYVTIDVDFLDPKDMPSTGTPLPGGLTLAQSVPLLEGLCSQRRIIGMDMVEFLPDKDPFSAAVAAELLLRALDASVTPLPQG
ncbi:arginase family protein [Streptacidiphilus rugosus]|uniref:arginase family protein n=1 Tax=Streptacidiphilus rugosus TaxID=405783 RepID=UPI0005601794|nr:arginase family protein [Streptacidiphilus rugosus]